MTQGPSEDSQEPWEISPRRQRRKKSSSKTSQPETQDASAVITTVIVRIPTFSPRPTPSMAQPTRLLVCSIGNPAPYLSTFHSAGHVVLNSLRTSLSQPAFMKSRAHGNGQLSAGSEYTLWQSSSMMNISGVGVAAAWRQFTRDTPSDMATKLVIVHDELELPLGQVKTKKGELSVKGHNGLKSCKEQLRDVDWWRIGVGIGRPVSREPAQVANYVLKKMGPVERVKIEGSALKVEAELRRLAAAGP